MRHVTRFPLPLRCLIGICLVAVAAPALAEKDVDGLENLLPHHETEAERQTWAGREDQMPQLFLRDGPPVGPVRNCAEWEPATGVLIRYPLGLPYDLLCDMDDQLRLHIIVSSKYQNAAQTNLAAAGVDMNQVEFLVQDNDSIWTRDYGPWFIFDGSNSIGIINHTYNRPWRPDDDNIPYYFGNQQGIPVYSHSMYHTGGNYMTDGAHISCSTRLVYNEAASENNMSETEVNDLMAEYYGIENYSVLDYIESGGIHHIDTWAKFLDEEIVLVKDVWPDHHTYTTLNQRATLLASLQAGTGRNYQVHRIYCHDIGGDSPASYTNSLILNDHIYVPFFGNSTHDEAALEVYRQAAAGYTVDGYFYSGFLSDDALHCRTRGVMDRGMLRVSHIAVREDTDGPVTIAASITACSGEAVTEALLHYRHDGGPWHLIDLTPAADDSFTAVIPAPASDGECEYFLSVTDGSGRNEGMPRTQPSAYYAFTHTNGTSTVPGTAPRAVLHPNHPNPFNPATTIAFEVQYRDHVQLLIVDARGRLIRTLVEADIEPGHHEVLWDGKDESGRIPASGTYFFRLRVAGLQYTRAATLLK